MNDENELLEPLATEAGQQAIVRAIRDISSLEYAVRAEQAASQASAKAGEASQSAIEASDAESKAKDWATKTDTYVEQETITIPPEQEGEEPTTETINLYSARYYAALAQDIYNNMSFDSVPTENSNALLTSGTIYDALDNKADKSVTYTKTEVDTALNAKADQSTTYTKTEVDTALSNVQSTLTFDNVPTANSDNPVKSSGIKTALDDKQDTLTFDSTPTANSTNPVTSGGVYTALQNVNIDIDDEITEDSDNPVTSAAIYEALQNFTPSGDGDNIIVSDARMTVKSGTYTLTNNVVFGQDFPLVQITFDSPMPDDNYEVSLTKHSALQGSADLEAFVCNKTSNGFQIKFVQNSGTSISGNGVDWIAIRPNSYTREGMVEDVLFSNASGVNSGTINLSGNISDYDLIDIQIGKNGASFNSNIYTSSMLNNLIGNSVGIVIPRYHEDQMSIMITNDNTLSFGSVSTNVLLFKITGIKFGRYVSGVVVDTTVTQNSDAVVTSGAVYTALQALEARIAALEGN